MSDTHKSDLFLEQLMSEIATKDKLHYKKISGNIEFVHEHYPAQFAELLSLVYNYYEGLKESPATIATDYLKMINDYRIDGLYFYRHGVYRCKNQAEAYEKVYSKSEIMAYYMNALLVSQIFWKHHFNIYIYFQEKLKSYFNADAQLAVLDVGPGHGFFSYLIKKKFPDYASMDLVDISETSLLMTKSIIGYDGGKINYYNKDIFDFDETKKYDFIVLGEILEHLDDPKSILIKLASLLKKDGVFWITTPTNSPAIDHVYLFKSKKDVFDLVQSAGLEIVDAGSFIAEDVDEDTADQKKITNLVGLFCKNVNEVI